MIKSLKKDSEILNVYIMKYPFEHDNSVPICEARQYDMKNDTYEGKSSIDEKYFGWRLLEFACKDALGVDLNSLNPRKLETGKWVVDKYYISLSNSGSRVMVGVSTKPVGVDIQKMRERYFDQFVDKMCDEEIAYYKEKEPWKCFYMHIEKEAIYKCYGNGPMEWQKINTFEYKDRTYTNMIGDYYIAICSDLIRDGFNYKIYENNLLYDCRYEWLSGDDYDDISNGK